MSRLLEGGEREPGTTVHTHVQGPKMTMGVGISMCINNSDTARVYSLSPVAPSTTIAIQGCHH